MSAISDEDVYQRAAHAYQAHSQHHRDIDKLAAHEPFRAAVDAALDAAYPDPDAVLVDLDAANRELAAARAEIAAQAATIAELRAENAEFVRELAKEAEGNTQYGVRWDRYEHKPIDWQEWPEAEARYYVSLQPAGVATLVRRFVGPVQAVEETTE